MIRVCLFFLCFLPVFVGSGSEPASARGLTLGMALEPPHLDPTAGAAGAIDEIVYGNVFEGLTRIDRDGNVRPALAEKWTSAKNATEWDFTLRQNIRFSDGTRLDSSIVAFALDRARSEKSTNAQKRLFEPIANIIPLGESRVRIVLHKPVGNLPFVLAWGDAVIVAPDSAETNRTNPIGTGPYRLKTRRHGDTITLERNPHYGEGNPDRAPPVPDFVVFKFISDPNAALIAMLSGDIDAYPNFPSPEALERLREDGRFSIHIGTTEGETLLVLNQSLPFFSTRENRCALTRALNRRDIAKGAMFGTAPVINSHFAPHHPAWEDRISPIDYDPVQARRVLEKSGIRSLTLTLPPPSYARRSGEIIASQLRSVGINVQLLPIEWAQWLETVFSQHRYEMTIIAHTEPLDIDIYGREEYYFNYTNPAFLRLLERLERTANKTERDPIYKEMQRELATDCANIFLFQLPKIGVWKREIHGLWENAPIQANSVRDVQFDDSAKP